MPDFRDSFEQLDHCLVRRMQISRNPAMAVALTDRFDTVRLAAYGYANLEGLLPAQPDHLFAIGSIGKSFTALAILQAEEAGLLDLHAPVSDYLPWFQVKSTFGPITLHHLLTHTSGLVAGTEMSPDPRAEVWALRELETGFAPGQHFYYSNTGYKIAGLVLEAATGRRYEDVLWTGILEPLGMHSTHAVTTHALRPRAARGYRYLHDDRPAHPSQELVPTEWVETNSGDGCILTTAEDMARYARFFLNDGRNRGDTPLLSERNYRKMVEPMFEEDGEQYSYGLTLFTDEGIRHAGHGGDVPGYESYIWLDLDNRLAAITLMTTPYAPRASFLGLEYLRSLYLSNTPPELPPMPDYTHVVNAEAYVGRYASAGDTLTVEAHNHHLYITWGQGGERVLLEERGTDRFYAAHERFNRFLIGFGRDSAGRVVEITCGPEWFQKEDYDGPRSFDTPQAWAAYEGHYRAYNPWESNFRVYARKGQLLLGSPSGEEEILVPLGEGSFRIGEEAYIPERLVFDQQAGDHCLRAVRSGSPYYRFFTP